MSRKNAPNVVEAVVKSKRKKTFVMNLSSLRSLFEVTMWVGLLMIEMVKISLTTFIR